MKTLIVSAIAATLLGATLSASRFFAPNVHDEFDYQGKNDYGKLVAFDRLGNIYVAGTCTTGDSPYDTNFVLVKYNLLLVPQWSRDYDGPVNEDETLTGLAVAPNGNVFISGTSPGDGTGQDVAVIGWTPSGDFVWAGGDHASRWNSGGSTADKANDMAIDGSGNIAICGSTGSDALVIVFESDGDVKYGWPQTFEGNSTAEFSAISISSEGHVAAAGVQRPESPPTQLLVAWYNGGGSLLGSDVDAYGSEPTEGVDVVYSTSQNIAVAANVYVSSVQRGAVYRYSEASETEGPEWLRLYGSESHLNAIASNGVNDFATGYSGDAVLTICLLDSNGNYNTAWSSDGIDLYYGELEEARGNAVAVVGNNCFVGGKAQSPSRPYRAALALFDAGIRPVRRLNAGRSVSNGEPIGRRCSSRSQLLGWRDPVLDRRTIRP